METIRVEVEAREASEALTVAMGRYRLSQNKGIRKGNQPLAP